MIKEEGINFNQMICLACCNGLDVQAHQMTDNDDSEEALNTFRYYNCAATQENRSSGFPTRSDTNRPVQSQKQARGLKFRI